VLKPIDYLSLKRFEPSQKPLSNHSNYSNQVPFPNKLKEENIFARDSPSRDFAFRQNIWDPHIVEWNPTPSYNGMKAFLDKEDERLFDTIETKKNDFIEN